jgi:hypothetical protein
MAGTPLHIVHFEHQANGQTKGVPWDGVRQWLLDHGFTMRKQWPNDLCWVWQDVEAEPFTEASELIELSLTFTLSPVAPSRWGVWQALVTDLCETFDLGLADAARGIRVGPGELFRILSETVSWREFHERYHWPESVAGGK